ncbi:MAG: tRNA lysidine(34) synthetase TilS [Sphingomonadaceae bacterium]|uniref:tRNA lysidine(34) synthetase TilS n=1 Tax=Thermaurantiacus sp. TaxID=2820283 RepID=UPI00298F10ED|nr:tRNA lysidine(34) synthetase TilS [Thermaurantiacus sp.]MCS6987451.1 tRNA lysidine(34) synthetase TilS [Sphingomonadaceae bacterium]MDW8415371.1 tRNA lysidine(34) synthetase TilS [Thermaurantiacus sp.]
MPAVTALTPEALRAEVARLAGPAAQGPFLVAVSGGPDSLSLLRLAALAWPGRIEAATVDHGVRPASAAEAHAVAGICAGLGVPHAILPPDGPIGPTRLQAMARTARYRALARHARVRGLAAALTAHHADDQAETLVMRLNRAAGLAGLAGVRARQEIEGLLVLRPLLSVRRAALHAVLRGLDWPVARDPTNEDPRFERARARRLLAQGGLNARQAARSAALLAEADEALAWVARRVLETRRLPDGGLDLAGLPSEVARRALALAFAERGAEPSGEALARLWDRGGGTLAGLRARSRGGVFHLHPAPPRRSLAPPVDSSAPPP